MKPIHRLFENKDVTAWVLMSSAIAVHVFDETLTDFLPFYNQSILDLRRSLGFFTFPVLSYGLWLGGLITGIAVCFALTSVVGRGGKIIRIVTTVLGVIMVMNALAHMLGSAYFDRLLPGFWSSPFLLVTAGLVVVRGFRGPSGT